MASDAAIDTRAREIMARINRRRDQRAQPLPDATPAPQPNPGATQPTKQGE